LKHTPYIVAVMLVENLCLDSDVSSDKVTVLLVVKDEGPGISAEDQKKLFKNFVQIRPGKLQKGGGSGLGLTIAKQIVELHGGRIGVTSMEGHGSQFYFAIPFQVRLLVRCSIEECAIIFLGRLCSRLRRTAA
jgi:signal transduction histidine kinase